LCKSVVTARIYREECERTTPERIKIIRKRAASENNKKRESERASEWTLASLASRSESEIALFQPNSPGLGSIGEALDYYYYYYSDAAAVLLPIHTHMLV
jgi:hypothetical protein